jgi:hypothetical protein
MMLLRYVFTLLTMLSLAPLAAPPATAPALPGRALATQAPPAQGPLTSTTGVLEAWWLNPTGVTAPYFAGAPVNVQSVETVIINGVTYARVRMSGIPSETFTMTTAISNALAARPRASTDFLNGHGPNVALNTVVQFGQSIGYNSPACAMGYWPPGPGCPSNQSREVYFPLVPQPATTTVNSGLASIGIWVNGSAIFNWSDGLSYNAINGRAEMNGQRVWQTNAPALEAYDVDVCVGHAAQGNYHHHETPGCIRDALGDNGSGPSPIYGFAADGYPVYGPWEAAGQLAVSGWITRDYGLGSPTGCGVANRRTCLLVNQYDAAQGVIQLTNPISYGPYTTGTITSLSSNVIAAVSGVFFQDYYYSSAACPACLDPYNGHDLGDGRGYHYHTTLRQVGDKFAPAFPYTFGPRFAGALAYNNLTLPNVPRALRVVNNSPKPVNIAVNFTNTISGTGFSYVWNFGDGGTATGSNPTRAYAVAGTYTATITATRTGETQVTFSTVTVALAGTGGGSVGSAPSGLNCGGTCAASFSAGTVVTLTATPNATSIFAGWSGAGCGGVGNCVVILAANQNVTATFNANYWQYVPWVGR